MADDQTPTLTPTQKRLASLRASLAAVEKQMDDCSEASVSGAFHYSNRSYQELRRRKISLERQILRLTKGAGSRIYNGTTLLHPW